MTLEEKIAAIWPNDLNYVSKYREPIVITWGKDNSRVDIAVTQMYEYVPANFSHLKALAELFGTEEINMNNWSSGGCETCDYGSNYEVTFQILNPTKELPNG